MNEIIREEETIYIVGRIYTLGNGVAIYKTEILVGVADRTEY